MWEERARARPLQNIRSQMARPVHTGCAPRVRLGGDL
jgi:hypothetical protein